MFRGMRAVNVAGMRPAHVATTRPAHVATTRAANAAGARAARLPGPPAMGFRATRAMVMSVALAGIAATATAGSLVWLNAPRTSAVWSAPAPIASFPGLPPFTTPTARPSAHRVVRRHHASTQARVTTSTSAPTTGAQPSTTPPAAAAALPVVVNFIVLSRGAGTFQGEFDVVNNGRDPISGWEIALLLPGDTISAVSDASESVNDGMLTLTPLDAAEVVRPDGGTLTVRFTVHGNEMVPQACAFNEIACA
jgi:hypothetical protein